jgi:hypothetical protein
MTAREQRIIALIDAIAPTMTDADRQYMRASLVYGNLKLEDSRLERSTVEAAVRRSK